jgi:hypothetical protein
MDEDTEKNLTSTQQSSVPNITVADMDTEGEELLDYEEEPVNIEGGTRLQESLSEHDSDRTGFEVDDAGTTRPPKKPPRQCSNSQTNRAGCNRNRKRK